VTYLATDPTVSAVLARAADRPTLGLGPLQARIAADVALTGGRYSLYHLELGTGGGGGGHPPRPAPGPGAAPHFHRTFTESFHVLGGTVQFYDGQRWFAGGPGDHVVVPEGGVHAFRNDADLPATMLMLSTPGVRREDYFAELEAVVREGRQPSPQEWADLLARHDQYDV
jgi:mannose-6-phosphate isomerase-like protein (cupin superfamily)